MLLGLDHLVIAVADPEAAAAELERAVGLAITGSGRHEKVGTYNRLAWLGDTYLELIGVFDRSLVEAAGGSAVGKAVLPALDEGRPGLVTFALATDDVTAEVAALRTGGAELRGPITGSRLRPDGEVVRWHAAYPDLGPAGAPFLVEHEMTGAEWGEAARRARGSFVHPLGGRARVTAIELPVPDPDATSETYARTVGVPFAGGEARVGAQAIRLRRGDPAVAPATIEIRVLGGRGASREVDALRVRWRIVGDGARSAQ